MTKSLPMMICVMALALSACQSDGSKKQDDPKPDPVVTPSPSTSSEQGSASQGDAPKNQKTYAKLPAPKGGADDIDKVVRGKPLTELEALYGPPAQVIEVKLDEGVPEFRIELLNDYRPDDPASKGVVITEHLYHYPEDGYHGVIWYHEVDGALIGLQAATWLEGTEF